MLSRFFRQHQIRPAVAAFQQQHRGMTAFYLFVKNFHQDPEQVAKISHLESRSSKMKALGDYFKSLSEEERESLSAEAKALPKKEKSESKVVTIAQKHLQRYVELFASGAGEYPNPLIANQMLPKKKKAGGEDLSTRATRSVWYNALPEKYQKILRDDVLSGKLPPQSVSGKHLTTVLEKGLLPYLFEVQLPIAPNYFTLAKNYIQERGLGDSSAEEKLTKSEALKKFHYQCKEIPEEDNKALKTQAAQLNQERSNAVKQFHLLFTIAQPLLLDLPIAQRVSSFQRLLKNIQTHYLPPSQKKGKEAKKRQQLEEKKAKAAQRKKQNEEKKQEKLLKAQEMKEKKARAAAEKKKLQEKQQAKMLEKKQKKKSKVSSATTSEDASAQADDTTHSNPQ